MTQIGSFLFILLITFPVSFGFLYLTDLKVKEKLSWALVISISLSALIVGGTGDTYVEPF